MSLDRRMADEKRVKAAESAKMRAYGHPHSEDPRAIGKAASVHGAACSCMMCGNPRKHFNEKTLAERRVNQDLLDRYSEEM